MAQEFVFPVFVGLWVSSAVLLPIGIFLTYKAAKDSTLFNVESYKLFFKKLKLFFNIKARKEIN